MSADPPPTAAATVEGFVSVPPAPVSGAPAVPGYEVLELVGRGGMGKVYRARHRDLNRTVAIKLLVHEPDDKLLARFREETRAVAKLQHPNIAQLFESGTADGRPFFSQEFVEGGTLAQKFAGKPQDPQYAAGVVATIARAIQHSHDHGILHRDLKPGNVLLAADGTPKVTDFGLAKELTAANADGTTATHDGLTRTGEILGTPSYMPPEQASGVTSSLGPTADVYSLGAILYEALTGRPPFQSPEPLQTLLMVLSMDPVAPRTLLPKLPKDLETVCLKCLEKSPKKRYPTAAALADDLDRFRRGEPIVARPVGFFERTGKWARRRKAAAALVGVSALLLLAVVGFGVLETVNALRLRQANDALEAKNRELERLNADLEKSRGETETMLGYALSTMDEYHFALSERLATLPQGEKMRVEVLTQARATLDGLYTQNPKRQVVWEHIMSGYEQLGNALSQIGDTAGAEAAFRRSAEVAGKLAAAHPDQPRHLANRGVVLLKLSLSLDTQGKGAEAAARRDEGVTIATALDAAHPNDPATVNLNLLAAPYQHAEAVATGKPELMAVLYRRWVDLYRRLARLRPDDPHPRMKAVENELVLVGLLATLKKFDEAEALLAASKGAVDALPDDRTSAVRYLRAAYHEGVGTLAEYRDRPAAADDAYRLALAEYEALATDFPNSPNYRRNLVNIWSRIGNVWVFGGQPARGLESLRKAREVAAGLARDFPDNAQHKESLRVLDARIKEHTPPEKK